MDIYFLILHIEWATHQIFCVPDVQNMKSLTSFLRETFSQYRKAFGQPVTPIVLLVPGVNTLPYNID